MSNIKLFAGMELNTEDIHPSEVDKGDLLLTDHMIYRATTQAIYMGDRVDAEPVWSRRTNRAATGASTPLYPAGDEDGPRSFTRITAAY